MDRGHLPKRGRAAAYWGHRLHEIIRKELDREYPEDCVADAVNTTTTSIHALFISWALVGYQIHQEFYVNFLI